LKMQGGKRGEPIYDANNVCFNEYLSWLFHSASSSCSSLACQAMEHFSTHV
jgi:hypothetical protein